MKKIILVLLALLAIRIVLAGTPATLDVNPGAQSVGNDITITGDGTAYTKYIAFYDKFNRYAGNTYFDCSSWTCSGEEVIDYTLPSTWFNGTYRVVIFDADNGYSTVSTLFQVTGSSTTIPVALDLSISPDPVDLGETVTFIVDGEEYSKYAYLYENTGSGNFSYGTWKASVQFNCTTGSCGGISVLDYDIPSNWNTGDYYLEVYDNNINAYIRGYFDVE